jgi:hypothetical protein
MPTTAYCEQYALLSCDGHDLFYIGYTARPHNGAGQMIGGRIPNPTIFVILTMRRMEDISIELRAVQGT